MNNAEKFKEIFDIYATEVWAMSEEDFLTWINSDYYQTNEWILCSQTDDSPCEDVFCCDKWGNMDVGWLTINNGRWLCETNDGIIYDPIAWMPLPKPLIYIQPLCNSCKFGNRVWHEEPCRGCSGELYSPKENDNEEKNTYENYE